MLTLHMPSRQRCSRPASLFLWRAQCPTVCTACGHCGVDNLRDPSCNTCAGVYTEWCVEECAAFLHCFWDAPPPSPTARRRKLEADGGEEAAPPTHADPDTAEAAAAVEAARGLASDCEDLDASQVHELTEGHLHSCEDVLLKGLCSYSRAQQACPYTCDTERCGGGGAAAALRAHRTRMLKGSDCGGKNQASHR